MLHLKRVVLFLLALTLLPTATCAAPGFNLKLGARIRRALAPRSQKPVQTVKPPTTPRPGYPPTLPAHVPALPALPVSPRILHGFNATTLPRITWNEFSVRPEDFFAEPFSSQQAFTQRLVEHQNQYATYIQRVHIPQMQQRVIDALQPLKAEVAQQTQPADPFAWVANSIPADTNNLYLALSADALALQSLRRIFPALRQAMPQREIIVLTSYLPEGHVWQSARDMQVIGTMPMAQRLERSYYADVWNKLEELDIPVVGLEPEFVGGALDMSGQREGIFEYTDPQSGKEVPYQSVYDHTLQGQLIRQAHWQRVAKQYRAQHPDALLVVVTWMDAVLYTNPTEFVGQLPGKNFVAELLSEFRDDLLEYTLKDIGQPVRLPDYVRWQTPQLVQASGYDLRAKFPASLFR